MTPACAAAVLGASFLLGSGRAAGGKVAHTCSAADKQFLQTVRENMTQLGYWSDALLQDDVAPRVVVKQARSEADQIAATSPDDPTLTTTRSMLQTMLLQYAAGIHAKFHGGDAGIHMRLSYNLANQVHYLLVEAKSPLAAQGCDVSALLASS